MGLKEKMMDNMMAGMSAPERKEMIDAMMEKFFANMSDEEKREMMRNMMPRMMAGKGGASGAGMPMMGMMGAMMGAKEGGFDPMEMCRKMTAGIERSGSLAALSTPEIHTLFAEWSSQVQGELLKAIPEEGEIGLATLAEKLKLSAKSTAYFVAQLAQQDKIDLTLRRKKGK